MDSHKKLFICNCFVNEALSKTVHENEFDLSLFHFFVLFGSGKDILWGKSLHI